jgi:DNA primase
MDGSQPKYLNSPETPVFNKRLNLFGLNLVQKIRNIERLLIVEGYMDVISLHQADLPYAVASLGTALTDDQARLLKRYCSEVYIAYDGDSAGQKATARGLDILKEAGLRVKVVEFPDNLDPDDYARKFGRVGVEELMDQAASLIDYKLKSIAAQCSLSTEDGRRRYVTESCRDVLAKIISPVELDIYVKRLNRETGVSETAILEEASLERSAAKAAGYSAKGVRNTNAVVDGPSRMLEYRPAESRKDNALPEAERTLLMLALSDAKYADKLPECVDLIDFSMERGNIARLLYEGKIRNSNAAAIMNQLEANEQSELAKCC